MTKNQMIHLISRQDRYGEMLIACLDKYGCSNTQDITPEQLSEFIKNNNLEDDNVKHH